MAETTMPTAEAEAVLTGDEERVSYELAFHVLPTVVEGEVPAIFDTIKKIIADAEGEIIDEEAPQRFDLAYDIIKYVEGKNRRFSSAYFGWVRFQAEPSVVHGITQAVEGRSEILRHLLIRLTREEEAHPFRFHEALEAEKQVTTVEETEVPEAPAAEGTESETETKAADTEDTTASDETTDDTANESDPEDTPKKDES